MLCYVIRGCDKGQKHKAMPKNVKEELKSFPITSKVMIIIPCNMVIAFNIALFIKDNF